MGIGLPSASWAVHIPTLSLHQLPAVQSLSTEQGNATAGAISAVRVAQMSDLVSQVSRMLGIRPMVRRADVGTDGSQESPCSTSADISQMNGAGSFRAAP